MVMKSHLRVYLICSFAVHDNIWPSIVIVLWWYMCFSVLYLYISQELSRSGRFRVELQTRVWLHTSGGSWGSWGGHIVKNYVSNQYIHGILHFLKHIFLTNGCRMSWIRTFAQKCFNRQRRKTFFFHKLATIWLEASLLLLNIHNFWVQ